MKNKQNKTVWYYAINNIKSEFFWKKLIFNNILDDNFIAYLKTFN